MFSIFINYTFLFHPIKAKNWFYKPYQKITLQKVDGPLIANRLDIRVLKVRHNNKIYLEFLSKQENDSYFLINSVKLKGSRDGFYEYWKKEQPVSLLLSDENGDGTLDIIAPTFDRFFKPHLNLVVYNLKTKKFELIHSFNYPKVIFPKTRDY